MGQILTIEASYFWKKLSKTPGKIFQPYLTENEGKKGFAIYRFDLHEYGGHLQKIKPKSRKYSEILRF